VSPTRASIRFGVFELDLRAGELRKNGSKIKVQEQPLQLLQILLEQPGQVVSREELQRRIWPSDTFVAFDQGLYNAAKRLREALGDTAESPHFIETVPRRGYRFIGNAEAATSLSSAHIRSLAVLPLENLAGDPGQEFFADGITEALITNLAKIQALQVVSRTSVMQYKGVHRPLREIARELQVEGIVEGTVVRSVERVRISAQLIDARTDTHLWAETYDRDLGDVLELQSEVARAIAREVKVKISPQEQAQLEQTPPVDPEAYEAYLKGRYYWNMRTGEAVSKGVAHFDRAVALDPTYAAAHAGLADSAAVLAWWGYAPPPQGFLRAKDAARTALALDGTLPEPHACLAFTLLHYDFDFVAAEAEFKRALEINPRYATAAQWYAIALYLLGRVEESIAELQRATRLDPISPIIRWTLGHFLFFARRYDEVIEEAHKLLELHPDSGFGRHILGIASAKKGIYGKAVSALTEACRLSGRTPNFLGSLGFACAAAGLRDSALDIARELQERFPSAYPMAYWTAMIYANLGDEDEADRWLQTGYNERSAHMFTSASILDSIRSAMTRDFMVF
jgi:TolB-like protein/Flp pilus assembly protein TadD